MFAFVQELQRVSQMTNVSKREQAELMAAIRLPTPLRFISRNMIWIIVGSMWLIPSFICLRTFVFLNQHPANLWWVQLGYLILPVLFASLFVLTGSLFAQVGKFGIIAGKFPRTPDHPIYALRRVYGTAWTQIFYFKPLLSAILAVPTLKRILLRLYGYQGDLDFVVYPDTWIRDLPMLKIGRGSYLANRSSVGSNFCLSDGSILVGPVIFGENTMLGHFASHGPDLITGKNVEIGSCSTLGFRVRIKDNVSISPRVGIHHAVEIGEGTKIGGAAAIGVGVKIGPNINIRQGASIPQGAVILTQEDADRYFSSETQRLRVERDDLIQVLKDHFDAKA